MIKLIRKEPAYFILFGSILLSMTCIGFKFKSQYFPYFPISPPMTEYGENQQFDFLIEKVNKEWIFLFERDRTIVTTDIYGEDYSTLLNIKEVTGEKNAFILGYSSISPGYDYFATNYRIKLDNDDRIDKVLILNLRNDDFIDILPEISEYKLAWDNPPVWLSDDVFLVKMHKFTTNAHSEEIIYIRYDIHDLSSEDYIALVRCPHAKTFFKDTNTLLLSNNCQYNSPIYAIDTNGLRLASEKEKNYYEYYYEDCFQNILDGNCLNHKLFEFPNVKIERVVGFGFFDPFGNAYEINRNRFNVYLKEDIVRISDEYMDYEPIWEEELGLFIWHEGNITYFMDEHGHYHKWFQGEYVGALEKE